jgi:hypothetical protein
LKSLIQFRGQSNPIEESHNFRGFFQLAANGYVLAMVGHLKNVSPAFAQMPKRNTNVEFTTVSPTIANTMLAVRCFLVMSHFNLLL